MDIPHELLLNHICACIVHTDLEVGDALVTLDRPGHTLEEIQAFEDAILHRQLEQCPLCNLWTWNSPKHWNIYKGCCTRCSDDDG
jgi:hypothetical protein